MESPTGSLAHVDPEDVELVAISDKIRTVQLSVYKEAGRNHWGWPEGVVTRRDEWLASVRKDYVGDSKPAKPIVYHCHCTLERTSLGNQCCGIHTNLPDLIKSIKDSEHLFFAPPEGFEIVAIFPGGVSTVPRNVCSEAYDRYGIILRRWHGPEDITARQDTWLTG